MLNVNPTNFAFYEKRIPEELDQEEVKGGMPCLLTPNGVIHIRRLSGVMGEEPNTIHRWTDMNTFDEKAVPVPNGYERIDPPSDEWIKKYFYNPNMKYVELRKVPEYDQEHYFIHDNGGRPFVVYLQQSPSDEQVANLSNKSTIYRMPNEKEDYYIHDEHYDNKSTRRQLYQHMVGEYRYKKAFIGESPLNDMTSWGGGHGPNFRGNSILLHLDGLEYLHISASIKKFTAFAPIVFYDASVGNNDVPYPYCEDADGRLYMMLDDVCMNKPESDSAAVHPYHVYYDGAEMLAHDCVNFKDHAFGGYKGFYIDGEPYLMRWESQPEQNYERLLRFNEEENGGVDSKLELMKDDGTLVSCTKEMYVDLHELFGRVHGYGTFKAEVVHERIW